ncbi:hypothetical protein GCM10009554_60390 [Kribbella koreensis]|uniref:Uncharacterized protein n=2 Tax=Kribbella TaxID=182639 RepID=A0ABP6W0H6_9ACTN
MDNTTTDQAVTYESDEAHGGGLHGSSPAAWTAVVIVLVGFTLGAIAMVMGPDWLLFWISAGIAVAGGLVGKVMQLLGFGVKSDDHH